CRLAWSSTSAYDRARSETAGAGIETGIAFRQEKLYKQFCLSSAFSLAASAYTLPQGMKRQASFSTTETARPRTPVKRFGWKPIAVFLCCRTLSFNQEITV